MIPVRSRFYKKAACPFCPDTLLNILSHPFDDQPEFTAFAEPAPDGQRCYRTFCGT